MCRYALPVCATRSFGSRLVWLFLPAREEAGGEMDDQAVGENLAVGASVVEVISEFSDAWAGTNAIDDDLSTEWATAGDGDDGFVTIDLGSRQDVAGVEFLTRSIADGSAIANEFFVVVDDGDRMGSFPAGNPANPKFIAMDFAGKIIRFEIDTSTGGNTGAIEIRVFAPASGTGGGEARLASGSAAGAGRRLGFVAVQTLLLVALIALPPATLWLHPRRALEEGHASADARRGEAAGLTLLSQRARRVLGAVGQVEPETRRAGAILRQ